MDLTRRRFLGASGTAALTAGSLWAAPPAAASADLTADELAVVTRLAKLVAVFPLPYPVDAGTETPAARIANATGDAVQGLSRARRTAARRGIALLRPFAGASDERLRAALAQSDPGTVVAVVALAANLVSARCDPEDDGPAAIWLAAVHRYHQADKGTGR